MWCARNVCILCGGIEKKRVWASEKKIDRTPPRRAHNIILYRAYLLRGHICGRCTSTIPALCVAGRTLEMLFFLIRVYVEWMTIRRRRRRLLRRIRAKGLVSVARSCAYAPRGYGREKDFFVFLSCDAAGESRRKYGERATVYIHFFYYYYYIQAEDGEGVCTDEREIFLLFFFLQRFWTYIFWFYSDARFFFLCPYTKIVPKGVLRLCISFPVPNFKPVLWRCHFSQCIFFQAYARKKKLYKKRNVSSNSRLPIVNFHVVSNN